MKQKKSKTPYLKYVLTGAALVATGYLLKEI